LWRDPDDVSHCQILFPDKTEWQLISATLCGWRRCFVADQLRFMTCIREEDLGVVTRASWHCYVQAWRQRPVTSKCAQWATIARLTFKLFVMLECSWCVRAFRQHCVLCCWFYSHTVQVLCIMLHDVCLLSAYTVHCWWVIMPPPIEKGAVSVAFVSPSVVYIANNSRTQRPSMPTFGATHIPVSRSNGQRSRSPGPSMLTHVVRHIFRTARPTNFKLGIRMEDDDPHHQQAPWPPRSKVKVARSRDQSEPSWPNAVPVSSEADGGISCQPKPVATLLV